MRRQQSTVKRFELLLVAATLACHANSYRRGFRQRDVRWMIEFSAGWAYPEFEEGAVQLDNTQIRRYLERLVADDLAKRVSRGKVPRYRLTRIGLLELVSGVVNRGFYSNKEEFFYLYLIVRDYRQRIKKMIEQEGAALPYAMRLELESLLDSKAVVENQLNNAKRELMKLSRRMQIQMETSGYVRDALADAVPYEELIKEVEMRFPFCLNSTISISQFLPGLTQNQALWELTVGLLRRNEHVWQPAKEALELHIRQLERLIADEEAERREQK